MPDVHLKDKSYWTVFNFVRFYSLQRSKGTWFMVPKGSRKFWAHRLNDTYIFFYWYFCYRGRKWSYYNNRNYNARGYVSFLLILLLPIHGHIIVTFSELKQVVSVVESHFHRVRQVCKELTASQYSLRMSNIYLILEHCETCQN